MIHHNVSHHPRLSRQLVMHLQNCLLDADIHVDDLRGELEGILRQLRAAVANRDALAERLSRAIEHARDQAKAA